MTLHDKARRIRAVVLDVDGVLTDGRIGYGEDGYEVKFFNVKDGHAIKMLRRAGIRVGMLSGRSSAANRRRAGELSLDFVVENARDKSGSLAGILEEHGLAPEECRYVGDDGVDLPVMKTCGRGVAEADAVP